MAKKHEEAAKAVNATRHRVISVSIAVLLAAAVALPAASAYDGAAAAHSCWVPSRAPITATVTWSQSETTEPCTWTLDTFSNYWAGTIIMVSAAWYVEYGAGGDGYPVAFQYWGLDWTYLATTTRVH